MKISLDSQIDLDEVIKMNMHNLLQVILKVDIYMGLSKTNRYETINHITVKINATNIE